MADSFKDAFGKQGIKSSQKRHSPEKTHNKYKELPDFYLDKEKKNLNPLWFEKTAEEKAKEFAKARLTSAQIRRFYGDILALYEKAETQNFSRVFPLIKMLKSKAAYAASESKSGRIPLSFRFFLEEMIDRVNDQRDYKALKMYFEAVVGFFYGQKGVK